MNAPCPALYPVCWSRVTRGRRYVCISINQQSINQSQNLYKATHGHKATHGPRVADPSATTCVMCTYIYKYFRRYRYRHHTAQAHALLYRPAAPRHTPRQSSGVSQTPHTTHPTRLARLVPPQAGIRHNKTTIYRVAVVCVADPKRGRWGRGRGSRRVIN